MGDEVVLYGMNKQTPLETLDQLEESDKSDDLKQKLMELLKDNLELTANFNSFYNTLNIELKFAGVDITRRSTHISPRTDRPISF